MFERLFGIREDTESAIDKLLARAAHRDRLLREAHAPPDRAAKSA